MSDWQRLGNYVLSRRVMLGFKQRGGFAAAIGVSARVVSDLEHGRRGNFDAVTIASLEQVLGWETGSAARIAAGGEPTLRAVAAPAPADPDSVGPSDEIELIYASRTMTARQKLNAIRMVLELRRQADTDTAGPGTERHEAPQFRARNHV